MRIRCPSTSSVICLDPPKSKLRPTAPRKKVGQLGKSAAGQKVAYKSPRHVPGKMERRDSASEAAKLVQKRGKSKSKKVKREKKVQRRPYSFIYVGNLAPTITEEQLRERFSPCGPILRVIVRCSRGQVIRVVPEAMRLRHSFGPRDRKYASIEFKDSKAYLKALELNGQLLDGANMIVCCSARDLPEAKEPSDIDILMEDDQLRIPNKTDTVATNNHSHNSIPNIPTPVKQQSQPVVQPPSTSPRVTSERDRFHWLGMSFAKCII